MPVAVLRHEVLYELLLLGAPNFFANALDKLELSRGVELRQCCRV
jgi:hypothetical protein